MTPKRPVFKYA